MTALTSLGRRGWETARSVRQHALRVPLVDRLLVGLLALLAIVDGARAFFPFYIRGDLLYHWGLARTILHGQFPPGGPYEGLPAYYPPGFHLLLAAGSRLSGLDVTAVTMILGLAWLPVLPLTTYLLARRLTGRPNVAILAAVLTAFGGGFDLSPDRLWVNSLFPSGQEAYPLYPRDLVFGLLPLAIWAFSGGRQEVAPLGAVGPRRDELKRGIGALVADGSTALYASARAGVTFLRSRADDFDPSLWFLVRDEPNLSGWQSGLMTKDGLMKPAFSAFRNLPR